MVFHLLAGILSLLTSSLAYLVATIIFSKNLVMVSTFVLALLAIVLIIGIIRLLFSHRTHGIRGAMHGMHSGYSLRRVAVLFKRTMEREIVSGGVARIASFGTIYYLFTNNLLAIYASAVLIAVLTILLIISHRSHLSDIMSGFVIGCGVGFLSYKFAPLLISNFGF